MQAFPRPHSVNNSGDYPEQHYSQVGMTLRDYFAGQVLAGLAADPNLSPNLDQHSEFAYSWADAMLKVRNREMEKEKANALPF